MDGRLKIVRCYGKFNSVKPEITITNISKFQAAVVGSSTGKSNQNEFQ